MTTGDALREVAQLIDTLQRMGVGVEDVSVADDVDGPLVDLSVRLPDGTGNLQDRTATEMIGDGVSGVDDPNTTTEPAESDAPEESEREENSVPDGGSSAEAVAESGQEVPCRVDSCDRTFDTSHGMKIHAAKAHEVADASGSQPHRNPDRLREVYADNETFADMRDALEADVTAQTVRRNMMKFGIHEPDEQPVEGHAAAAASADPDDISKDSEQGAGADEPASDSAVPDEPAEDERRSETDEQPDTEVVAETAEPSEDESGEDPESGPSDDAGEQPAQTETVADGGPGDGRLLDQVSVPDTMNVPDVDLMELADAARDARTLYEFQQSLGIDRSTAKELVGTFDLRDAVTGRVQTESDRRPPAEEVARRIANAVDARGGDGGASAD